MKVSFVCLANSRKLGGRCVAGIRRDGSGWIRPVNRISSGTLSRGDCRLNDGSEASNLDIIEVEVSNHRPEPHQPENWVLESTPWRLIDRLDPSSALSLLTPFLWVEPVLLGNQYDRVSYDVLKDKPAEASLALVEPVVVSWVITENSRGNRQTRANFQLGRQQYNLVITDFKWVERLSHLTYGSHPREAAVIARDERLLFTISLGEPFNGECYKLVAAVVVLPGR